MIESIVDASRYALGSSGSASYAACVRRARESLHADGSCVIPGFIRADHRSILQHQCASTACGAYYREESVNVYNRSSEASYEADHPGRIRWVRGNAFVARDLIPEESLIQQLYACQLFQRFVADCFELDRVFPLADPLSGLCVNVIRPGLSHPWHFDTNEFTVSLLTQAPEAGGEFDYCPNIRDADHENLSAVRSVIEGRGGERVRSLALKCGDLQLFKGRYSLHRVRQVKGSIQRHSVIFAYDRSPGIVGRAERTRQLFGRLSSLHTSSEKEGVRNDALLD